MMNLAQCIILHITIKMFYICASGRPSVNINTRNLEIQKSAVVTCTESGRCGSLSSPNVNYEWTKFGVTLQKGASNKYNFSVISLNDFGTVYQCIVRNNSIEIGRTNFTLNAYRKLVYFQQYINKMIDLKLNNFWQCCVFVVSNPLLIINRSPTGNNYVGQYFNVTCYGIANPAQVNLNFTFTDPQGNVIVPGEKYDRVTVTQLEQNRLVYGTTLSFNPLSGVDNGEYACTEVTMLDSLNPNVVNSAIKSIFSISLDRKLADKKYYHWWRASVASETITGVTQLKIGDVCLSVCMDVRRSFCTLTPAYFCVRSAFYPVPNFTKQYPLV